ncbi:MAG: TonB-dependent receptor, partial [Acidobacteria bacterium]
MQTGTRKATVILGQNTAADVKLGLQGVSESITVTAETTMVDKSSTALQNGLSQQQITTLPLTQNYSDLQKLIPGVMYTQDTVRGPSAGASGQDNVYLFDGANITMPLFGVLVVNPNTNDIAQVNMIRGGAKAVDFESGTNKYTGLVGYQELNHSFIADQKGTQNLIYQNNSNWATASVGGPILQDRLFFYGSYYRPYATRANASNLYGALPQYKLTRNEEFGKLTFTPTESWLLNGSWRHSHEVQTTSAFGSMQAPTAGTGYQSKLDLGNLEGSKIINPKSFATFKLVDFRNPGGGRADNLVSGVVVSTAVGTRLDINNLDKIGRLVVPKAVPANAAFVQPYINKYGFICPQNPAAQNLTCTAGQLTGGGTVGTGLYTADNDSFFRKGGQVGYNYTFGAEATHDLHAGYQRYKDSEDRFQTSNGWGEISIPGGSGASGTNCPKPLCGPADVPAFFIASFSPQGIGTVPIIHSEFHSQNFEINDTIHFRNWSFNVGVMDSNDVLYGQGLAKADNVAGFVSSPGTKYKMHEWTWSQGFQPRLGATWAYNGSDTVFASLARYMPPANSDARAASWDRNLVQAVNAYFDANGNLIGAQPNSSSSGKWWQAGIKPPEIKEFMLGTARQLMSAWSARLYGRARKGGHYIEDTNNNARIAFQPPPGVRQELYVPDLGTVATPGSIRNAIGSGSSYVIANLDGAFTKYLEATAESEWRGSKAVVHGSYTWSHYYGNFDQDNSSFNTANDAAIFIGSSNIGDGAGRQLWNFKYGDLRGDRRNNVKVYGTYFLPWHATTGAFFVFQSGQPYQLESVLPYRALTGSGSETNR